MSRWRFNLRQSRDLSLIGELTGAGGKTLTLAHNSPGNASFDYSMSDQYSAILQPYKTAISVEQFNWRKTLARNQAGIPGESWDWIWSGYVLPIDEDWTGDRMKISCVGWAQRLANRMLHADQVYTTLDDGEIIRRLVNYANAPTVAYADGSTYPVPTVAGSDPPTPTWIRSVAFVSNEGPGGPTAYVPRTPITITKQKFQYILPILDELTGVENGCDWWVHPQTRDLIVYRKRCTVRNIVVAFKWGPNNLGQFSRNIAADQKANYVLLTGANGISAMADNPDDMAENGMIESLTQWTDCNSTEVLLAEAGAQILMKENGRITYGITPFYYAGGIGKPPTAVPEPFVDYDPVGDEFKLTAIHPHRGNIMLQTVRSYGVTVSIDDQNNATLGQLTVAP